MKHAFPLERELIALHQQPLLHVLNFLIAAEERPHYRTLTTNVFVAATPLDFDKSNHRLASSGKHLSKSRKCPSLSCAKRFKKADALLLHISKHAELQQLSGPQWDELMSEGTVSSFTLLMRPQTPRTAHQ